MMEEAKNAKRKRSGIVSTVFECLKLVVDAGSTKDLIMTSIWLLSGTFISIVAIFEKNFFNDAQSTVKTGSDAFFHSALKWLAIWAAAVLFTNMLSFISNRTSQRMWDRMNYYIRERLMWKISHIKLAYFDNQDTYTKLDWVRKELSTRVSEVVSAAFEMISCVLQFATVAAVIISDNWFIAVVVILGSIPSVILSSRQTEDTYHHELYNSHEVRYQNYVSWVLFKRPFMKEMRFGNLYDHMNNVFEKAVMDLYKKRQKIIRKYALANGGARLISFSTIAVSLLMVCHEIYNGKAGIGSFALIYSSVQNMQSAFGGLFTNFVLIGNDGRFIDDYFDIMKYDEETLNAGGLNKNSSTCYSFFDNYYNDGKQNIESGDLKHKSKAAETINSEADLKNITVPQNADIEFNNVTFRYPDTDRIVLDSVSIKIKQGEKIAIVGENGSGKSTFIALLCGLYKPDNGTVLLSGMDVEDNTGILRKAISCTFQNFGIYEMSVADNIRVGDLDRDCSEEEIIEAAKMADAYEFIEKLSEGINTRIGTMKKSGTQLSGGQFQKIAMARALLKKDARILILDEPTAALDPIAEAKLYQDFNKLTGDKTTVLISHRLGATRLADRILVFDSGKIVEEGTHEELMAKEGLYTKMYRAQAQWYVA